MLDRVLTTVRYCIFCMSALAFRYYTHVRVLGTVWYLAAKRLFGYAYFKRRIHEAHRLIGKNARAVV